jgi:hypothetical protein
MRKYLSVFIPVFIIAVSMVQCKKNGTAIIEPKFGIYNFSTYTIDTFRFRIILNDINITDSLVSPVGNFSKIVSFFNTVGRLQIIDAKNNNQLVLDTLITMKTGTNNFSLVQFLHGQKPYIPATPSEPVPAIGNYKIRFLYTPFIGDNNFPPQPFFYDSVMCYIRKNGFDIDTVVLKKYEATPFYEAHGNGVDLFTIKLDDPANGNTIDPSTSPTIGSTFTGFNTVSVSGRTITDEWRLIRIY